MIAFSVRGHDHPKFKCTCADDHIAELCLLELDDVEDFFWCSAPDSKSMATRKMFEELDERIRMQNDLAAAETLYTIATHAAFQVMGLYLRHRDLFDQITPRRKLLPSLISIHPKTAKVMAAMEKYSRLGEHTEDAPLIRSKPWFTNDAPANVYARAIINSVGLNKHLKPVQVQQAEWVSYTERYGDLIEVLPFPKYIDGIDLLPTPITPASVLAYWRKGKEMILEEMPDFQTQPEWESYHHRTYQHGAKAGAIQHAIFKDILTALRTIAGCGKSSAAK